MNQKKKSCWIDQRTHKGLRDAAAAIAMACLTVQSSICWKSLTERNLEARFGRVRSMFPNFKLSAADFWRSSATNMRKELKTWRDQEGSPVVQDSGPVSSTTFAEVTDTAFAAALKMMSLCSGRSEQDLRSTYVMSKSCSKLRASAMNEDCDDQDQDGPDPPETTAEDLMHHVRDSQALSRAMDVDGEGDPEIKCDDARGMLLHERSKGHRGDPKIAAATAEVCDMGTDEPPKATAAEAVHPQEKLQKEIETLKKNTLAAALQSCENLEAAKHGLWLLLCYLRLGPRGCDSEVVKSHYHTRASLQTKVQKWHDAVRHQIAVVEAQERMPATRSSRVAGWVQNCEQLREQHMPTLPSTLSMHTGQVIAAYAHKTWHPALILSVWRAYKKGTGSQLAWREISRGAVNCARVVLFRHKGHQDHDNVFVCDSMSEFLVLGLENLGVRLDTEDMRQKKGIDGTKIQLTEDIGP